MTPEYCAKLAKFLFENKPRRDGGFVEVLNKPFEDQSPGVQETYIGLVHTVFDGIKKVKP